MVAVRAAVTVVGGERNRAPGVAHLDDHTPGALVRAQVARRKRPAQPGDAPRLVGGQLECHGIILGTNAEAHTKRRSTSAKERVALRRPSGARPDIVRAERWAP